MNKGILKLLFVGLVCTALGAATIDKNSIEIKFEGFKTPQMIGLEGKFNDVKYTFKSDGNVSNKTSDLSVASLLKGASAVIKTASLDTGVEDANKNLVGAFFKTLIGKNDIKVTIVDVMDGDNVGVILANVNMGSKKGVMFPLTYTITDGKLEAKGQLNLGMFNNSKKALEALSNAAPGHAGISWPLVNVTFSANISK